MEGIEESGAANSNLLLLFYPDDSSVQLLLLRTLNLSTLVLERLLSMLTNKDVIVGERQGRVLMGPTSRQRVVVRPHPRAQLPYNLGASPNLHDVGSQNQPADGEEEKFRHAEFGETLRQLRKYGCPEEEVMVARTREVMTIPVPVNASLWTPGGVSSRTTLVVGRVDEGQRSAEAPEVSGRCREALTAGRKLTGAPVSTWCSVVPNDDV